jgi:HPt (histidine-containing phosphotransfer) domain-containing protein
MDERDPILDIDALLGSVDGDCELLDEMAGTFTAEIPTWISELRAAVTRGDAETTFRVAHGVCGAASYVKSPAVQQAAAELEAMGRGASLAGAGSALDRLEVGLSRLGAILHTTPWRH